MSKKITGVCINETWKLNSKKLPNGLFMWYNVLNNESRKRVITDLVKLLD